jgi:hypothetical protein
MKGLSVSGLVSHEQKPFTKVSNRQHGGMIKTVPKNQDGLKVYLDFSPPLNRGVDSGG